MKKTRHQKMISSGMMRSGTRKIRLVGESSCGL
jgi:hypothetical protein